jgi:tetratricopeptide (TPR) repeat protein
MTAMTRVRRQAILRQATGYIELGELLVETDKPVPASAERILTRALALLAELPEPTRSLPATRMLEGEALRALGRWEDALDPLRAVTTDDPHRLEAWLGIGWCLKRLGRLDEAIAVLEQGLEATPQQPILHYNLACYLSLGGKAPAAIEHLTRAIAIDGRFRDLTEVEPDFDPIRCDPRFVAATSVTV